MGEEQRGRSKLRAVANVFAGLGGVIMLALSASVALGIEPPDRLAIPLMVAFCAVALAAAGLSMMASRGQKARTRAEKRELLQWNRWQACLFAWPVVITNFAFLADYQARRGAGGMIFVFVLPMWAFVFLTQIKPLKRGEPRSVERRLYEDLADELSREHASAALGAGYLALFAGAVGLLAAALFAPAWIVEAAIATIWLGFVVPCIRFGLLQRAADQGADHPHRCLAKGSRELGP